MKFTEDVVRAIALPPGVTDKVFFDESLPGFGLRVRASGVHSWMIQYAIDGCTRRVVIGKASVFKLAEARARARKLLAKVRLGGDPAADKKNANLELEQRIALEALMFLQRGVEPKCYLYRRYHPSGELLYVGVSLEPLRRQDSHLKRATWRDMICHILIEPFETREEALAAEEAAIRIEFPKFNLTHNARRHPFQELARRGT
jgi:Arm domain-containing DNA-binding protein